MCHESLLDCGRTIALEQKQMAIFTYWSQGHGVHPVISPIVVHAQSGRGSEKHQSWNSEEAGEIAQAELEGPSAIFSVQTLSRLCAE